MNMYFIPLLAWCSQCLRVLSGAVFVILFYCKVKTAVDSEGRIKRDLIAYYCVEYVVNHELLYRFVIDSMSFDTRIDVQNRT